MQIRGKPKVNLCLNLWIVAQIFAKFARNDGGFCHFERSEKSIEFKARFEFFEFMDTSPKAQYDKIECFL